MLSSSSEWQGGNICFVQRKILVLLVFRNIECKNKNAAHMIGLSEHWAINPGQAGSTCTTNVQTIENGPNYGIRVIEQISL